VLGEGASKTAAALLACAVTATGIRSNMKSLTQNGLKPLLVIVIATLIALGLSIVAAKVLIPG
ncbi:putative sulfate exporter family transporter, partial [Pseudomonas sp. HMWF010]